MTALITTRQSRLAAVLLGVIDGEAEPTRGREAQSPAADQRFARHIAHDAEAYTR